MGIIALTSVLLLLTLGLLFFARGGARETTTAGNLSAVGARAGPRGGSLVERAEGFIRALGFDIVRREPDDGRGPTFIAASRGGINRQQVYVCAFDLAPGERVREPDVVAALDLTHGEGYDKAFLISSSGFTDDAVLAARGTPAELIDEAILQRTLEDKAPIITA